MRHARLLADVHRRVLLVDEDNIVPELCDDLDELHQASLNWHIGIP
jgi:hypothetical protein